MYIDFVQHPGRPREPGTATGGGAAPRDSVASVSVTFFSRGVLLSAYAKDLRVGERRRCSGEKVGFCQAKLAYTHLYTSTRDTNAPNRRSWAGGGSGTTNEASASVIDTPYGSALAESPFPAGDGLQQHSIVQKAMTRMADALLAWSNSSSSSRSTSVSHRIHACRAREGRSERYTPCQELA